MEIVNKIIRCSLIVIIVSVIWIVSSIVVIDDPIEGYIKVVSEEQFVRIDEIGYIIKKTYLKNSPYQEAEDVIMLPKYETVNLTGTNKCAYWRVTYQNKTYYIDKNCITVDYAVLQAEIDKTYNHKWKGKVLNKRNGRVLGPSGKETYYNLNMSRVVEIMRKKGNYDKYWIREDGCKMLGDYIMCAADLSIRPKGTLLESTLGTCIVCDTGAFVKRDSHQIDIAVDW